MIQHLQVLHKVDIKIAERIISNDDTLMEVEKAKPTPTSTRPIQKPVKANAHPDKTLGSKRKDNSTSEKDNKLVENTNALSEAQSAENMTISETTADSQTNTNEKSEANVTMEMIPTDGIPNSVLDNSTLADISLSSSIVGVIQDLETPKIKSKPGPSRRTKHKVSNDTSNTLDISTSSKDKSKLECNSCQFTSDNRIEMITHAKAKHMNLTPTKTKPKALTNESATIESIVCILCDYVADKPEDMSDHMGVTEEGHFGPDKTVICPHCPYMPFSTQELLEHGKSHFARFTLNNYQCSKCINKFETVLKMEEHWALAHASK